MPSKMKLAIMQPYFFPYLGYFQLLRAVDKFVFYDDVNFIKGGWVNRNRLLINSQPNYFNAATVNASPNKLISQIELNPSNHWREKLLKTIKSGYGKAPQFREVLPLLENLIRIETNSLSEFNINSIKGIADYLDLTAETEVSSLKYDNRELRGAERVLDICRKNQADIYINPVGGQELYEKEKFGQYGVELHFIQMCVINYKQFKVEFVPHLSIIDVLMFNEKEVVQKFIANYTLI